MIGRLGPSIMVLVGNWLLLVATIVAVWLLIALMDLIAILQRTAILRPMVVLVTVIGRVRTLLWGRHMFVIELTHETIEHSVRVWQGDSLVHTVRKENRCCACGLDRKELMCCRSWLKFLSVIRWVRPLASRLSGSLRPWLTNLWTLSWHTPVMQLMNCWQLVVLLVLTPDLTLVVTCLGLVNMLTAELLGQKV